MKQSNEFFFIVILNKRPSKYYSIRSSGFKMLINLIDTNNYSEPKSGFQRNNRSNNGKSSFTQYMSTTNKIKFSESNK